MRAAGTVIGTVNDTASGPLSGLKSGLKSGPLKDVVINLIAEIPDVNRKDLVRCTRVAERTMTSPRWCGGDSSMMMTIGRTESDLRNDGEENIDEIV